MSEEQVSVARRESSRWDPLAERLRDLRARAGEPSYTVLAQQVMDRRIAAGMPAHSARIARTTVYDCFKTGRVRVNLGLVREIAAVLGAEDGEVDEWVARCREGAPEPAAQPTREESPSLPPRPQEEGPPAAPPTRRLLVLLVVGSVGLNLAGRGFEELLHLPVYLDMSGTAIAAMALGPWWGALVGALTNLAGVAVRGPASLPFGLVNVAGALIWGYGIRRFGCGRTLPRFLALSLLVAVVCTAIAVPILLLLFSGSTNHGQDAVGATILQLTGSKALAVTTSNLVVSVGDKMLSGFLALVALAALPLSLRTRASIQVLTPAERPDAAGSQV